MLWANIWAERARIISAWLDWRRWLENVPIATSFEIAAGVTGLMEQAFAPSVGKAEVDSMVDIAAQEFSRRANIPLPVVIEIVERQIKPRLQWLRDDIDHNRG